MNTRTLPLRLQQRLQKLAVQSRKNIKVIYYIFAHDRITGSLNVYAVYYNLSVPLLPYAVML